MLHTGLILQAGRGEGAAQGSEAEQKRGGKEIVYVEKAMLGLRYNCLPEPLLGTEVLGGSVFIRTSLPTPQSLTSERERERKRPCAQHPGGVCSLIAPFFFLAKHHFNKGSVCFSDDWK